MVQEAWEQTPEGPLKMKARMEKKQKSEPPKAPKKGLDDKKETEAWHKMQADLRKQGLYDN